ncbi:MAG TPA: hypothetical protein VMA86_05675 [Acetobacteraceae bacterium]|nr:hypothetical protein [Acetobacteraceae bacterium]
MKLKDYKVGNLMSRDVPHDVQCLARAGLRLQKTQGSAEKWDREKALTATMIVRGWRPSHNWTTVHEERWGLSGVTGEIYGPHLLTDEQVQDVVEEDRYGMPLAICGLYRAWKLARAAKNEAETKALQIEAAHRGWRIWLNAEGIPLCLWEPADARVDLIWLCRDGIDPNHRMSAHQILNMVRDFEQAL